ncbi:glycoside hydrolase family 32 protein [Corynebacterium wankanglinii]|uniref:beta-fructofuranosidase n=1 Tax=Corynebacterium wankanglinii TaxID=2735136 RepID=A0A838CIB8_9CORY|nr:glycoside hydrolase family 32 protein [Corynebacterium wankanglinii]MBA1834393.1 glycoside hydrolase family 32 protein [Corynebacterium wankanglinii]
MTYRPKHHLTAPQGRLNDPNGLTLVGDQLHVFYQHDPSFPLQQKRTGWGHAVTTLGSGEWRHFPMALYPDHPYDLNGCYSGSAVLDGDSLRLFYTGNLKRDGQRVTSQNIVDVHDIAGPMGGTYRRRANNPVIDGAPEGFTAHFRDPHVSKSADGTWRMVIGAQRTNQTGAVVLYTSADLDQWELAGALEFSGLNYNTASAYMWECPNLLRMTDQATGEELEVLVFCPQYPDSDECGYVVGTLDGTRFNVRTDFTPLDYGHQFYAPQLLPHGAGALALGWMGLPARDDTPSLAEEGWVHSLTLVRELVLIDGYLRTSLAIPKQPDMLVATHELAGAPWSAELVDVDGAVGAELAWQPQVGGRGVITLTVDGIARWAECAAGQLVLCADGAAVECTAGGGEVAFSSAVFSPGAAQWGELRVR